MTINNIYLFGWVKLLIVIITVCISLCLVFTGNWFQGLLVLNISLHYRNFIDFFTDFTDETLQSACQENNKILEKFSENSELGPANIELSNTYTKLYNELYGDNNTPQYSSFYNNNVNIDKIIKNYDNENRVAEGFYKQLYDNTHENNIIKKSKPFNNENFINYKLGEIDSYDLADFDAFSKLKFQKNQKINIRSKTLYPNDDIKLMNNIDLNHNIPWWQSASLIDGFN